VQQRSFIALADPSVDR
jgi:superfamily II DNA/RNA helicase